MMARDAGTASLVATQGTHSLSSVISVAGGHQALHFMDGGVAEDSTLGTGRCEQAGHPGAWQHNKTKQCEHRQHSDL